MDVVSRISTSVRRRWKTDMRGISQRIVKVGGALIRRAVGAACSFTCIVANASRSNAAVTSVR